MCAMKVQNLIVECNHMTHLYDCLMNRLCDWFTNSLQTNDNGTYTVLVLGRLALLIVSYLGPLHTWAWEPVTSTLQALSLVEKAELVQVCFTLHLRDQRSMWMHDGCRSPHGLLHDIKWTMFHGHLDYFQKMPLGGKPNTKPGDHGTPNTHKPLIHSIYIIREDPHE